MRSGKPASTASQSRSSRRGGRWSSRLSSLKLSCGLPSFHISYQNKWIVVASTWHVVRTYQCCLACLPDKSSVSFVVDRTHCANKLLRYAIYPFIRSTRETLQTCGESSSRRVYFFCCHAVVPRTRSVSRCLLYSIEKRLFARCDLRHGYGGNTREFRTQKKDKKWRPLFRHVFHAVRILYTIILLFLRRNLTQ